MNLSFDVMKLYAVFGILLFCGISLSASKRYDGYKLYRVTFERAQAGQVQALVNQIDGAEMWMFSMAKGIADIFVGPNVERQLVTGLGRKGLAFTLLNADVQGLIDGTVTA